MANDYSSGITYYTECNYEFTWRGFDLGCKYSHVGDEEWHEVQPYHHDTLPQFTEAYNRALNIFTSSHKPPTPPQ
tara:strand:- start:799 stop:1023 length:225 start_codon:yes stop_codon:yes gene_type:complete